MNKDELRMSLWFGVLIKLCGGFLIGLGMMGTIGFVVTNRLDIAVMSVLLTIIGVIMLGHKEDKYNGQCGASDVYHRKQRPKDEQG